MKIAIVLWETNIKGGTQRQALELAYNLQNMGHQVDVFSYYHNPEACYTELCEKLTIYYISSEKEKIIPLWKKIINEFYKNDRIIDLKKSYKKLR